MVWSQAFSRTMWGQSTRDCRWMRGRTRVESDWLPTRRPTTRWMGQKGTTGCLRGEGACLSRAGQPTEQLSFKERGDKQGMYILDVGRPQGRCLLFRGSLLEKEIGFFEKVQSFKIITKCFSIKRVMVKLKIANLIIKETLWQSPQFFGELLAHARSLPR